MLDSNAILRLAPAALPFEPTEEQAVLLQHLATFVASGEPRDAFILYGYAGTGKTSAIAALVAALTHTKIKTVLLAPTGRAAKVLSAYARKPAFTIHKRLYRGDALNPYASGFFLAPNRDKDTIFIVDEASMIPGHQSQILEHLIQHVYSSPGCSLIFVGDTAQLPPVGETTSPAMSPAVLEGYGLNIYAYELEKPLRQAARSGILYNATRIRRRMLKAPLPAARMWPGKFQDVCVTGSEFLAEQIADSYSQVGRDSTMVITRANWRASAFNRAIRATVLYSEERLQRDERLVIAKNNYFWTAKHPGAQFIANGEGAIVQRILGYETRYGHDWADVELQFPDTGLEIEAKLLLTVLDCEAASLPQEDFAKLYQDILSCMRAEGLQPGQELQAMRSNPYLNALQAKYGYCLTCHKAQGGQWKHIYIDLSGLTPEALVTPEMHRWLYTAVTRAVNRLFLINPSLPLNNAPEPEV